MQRRFGAKEIAASAARTVDGQTDAEVIIGTPEAVDAIGVLVDVTAFGGTSPTLDLKVQWSHNGIEWADAEPADSFNQITAAKKVVKRFSVKAPLYRVAWTLAGTSPSFTFSLHATAI